MVKFQKNSIYTHTNGQILFPWKRTYSVQVCYSDTQSEEALVYRVQSGTGQFLLHDFWFKHILLAKTIGWQAGQPILGSLVH